MGMLIMKLLSGTKKLQMLYNKNNATYNILINHLFLVPLPKRNAKVLVTS